MGEKRSLLRLEDYVGFYQAELVGETVRDRERFMNLIIYTGKELLNI